MPSKNRSFGLMDLVACASILVMLASLGIGGWQHAKTTFARTASVFTHAGILRGVEDFKSQTGNYPEPAHPEATAVIDGKTYRIGGAMMLYQVLSCDGTNEIAATASTGKPSNGTLADDGAVNSSWPDLIQSLNCWRLVDGHYFLVDDFGHPFQYQKGETPDAVNSNFDAWSVAEDDATSNAFTEASKKDASVTARWIKNF